MEATATAKFMRVSPRKARLVVDLIRGKKIADARTILSLAKKASAVTVKKVLDSAIANAENNEGADIDELKVKTICVDEGPVLKRLHARAKGRADRIVKRTSHITVTVADE